MTNSVLEPARSTPVWQECDLCVVGGSATGVFAAVRAARLGLKVVLVERMGCFGGVATLSLVNVWHNCRDERFERQIIGGLSLEVIERLKRSDSVTTWDRNPEWEWIFNPQELQIELDALVIEAGVKPYLHTLFVAPYVREGRLEGVFVENKSGRGVILAKQFIDASGDGDLAFHLGLECYTPDAIQPATTCAVFSGWEGLDGVNWKLLLQKHGHEFGLHADFAWGCHLPHSDLYMLAGTRIRDCDLSNGENLTCAEMEGRRQVRAIRDLLTRYVPESRLRLQTLPSRIGIRQTRHIKCRTQLTGDDVLRGRRFPDAIANGSYRVDVHHPDRPGITLRYLDGRQEYRRPGFAAEKTRWRPEGGDSPTFYQIPLSSMIQDRHPNLVIAGRMLDADPTAHAAIRVMINLNQVGEAAGVTAAIALQSGADSANVPSGMVRKTLADGGSIIV